MTPTYWLEPTEFIEIGLRRYTVGQGGFDCAHGHHQALVIIGKATAAFDEANGRRYLRQRDDGLATSDPRWPTKCEGCDYVFEPEDKWQHWSDLLYRRTDTGEEMTLRNAPPGACWDAWWMPSNWRDRSPDGIYLMVRLPNRHDWAVDSEASNCTRKGEKHQCWVRHGDPRECRVTVDKDGDTCAAGAGSILAGDYHGFLQNGILT